MALPIFAPPNSAAMIAWMGNATTITAMAIPARTHQRRWDTTR